MATGEVALDLTQYVRINAGLNPLMLQAHRDAVRVAFSDQKPVFSNSAFHMLSGEADLPYHIPTIDTNVWALAVTDRSSLIVTEFSGEQVDTLSELAHLLNRQLLKMTSNQHEMNRELSLLNARIEEAFETTIDEDDL